MQFRPFDPQPVFSWLGGWNRLRAMVNMKNVVRSDDGQWVSFKFSNRSGHNFVKVKLNDSDLYDVQFGRIVRYELRNVSEHSMIQGAALRELFERETGLYLSL